MYRIIILFILFFISNLAISQESTGLLPIEKFNSDNLGAQPHSFAFTEDSRNAIYVGNKDGLLVYTGSWKKFLTNNASEIRALTAGFDGNIYIGNQFGFGYFTPNDSGVFVYTPLDTLVKQQSKEKITNIQMVLKKDSSIYFVSGNYIYKYYNNALKVIKLQDNISGMSLIENKILVILNNKGLFELIDDKLELITNNKKLFVSKDGKKEIIIGPIQAFGKNEILYLTKNTEKKELRILNLITKEDRHFSTQIDDLIQKIKAKSVLKINNKFIAVSLHNNGIILLDIKGNFIRKLDKASGLQSDVIENMYADKNNILWLAHVNGISRVDIFSNYEYVTLEKLGVKKAIEDMVNFNDTLFMAVQSQLSYFKNPTFSRNKKLSINDIKELSNPKCLVVNNPLSKGNGCYDLLDFKLKNYNSLLIITNNNVLEKSLDGSMRVIFPESGYKLFQDLKEPNRVWISIYPNGLASMYFNNGEWINEGKIENAAYEIYSINADTDNNILMGVYGVLKLETPVFVDHKIVNPKVTLFDTTNGLSANDAYYIHRDNDKLLYAADDGIFEYSAKNDTFVKSDYFGEWMKNHFTLRFYKDSHGKTWTISYPKDKTKVFIKSLSKNSEGGFFMNTEFSKKITAQKFLSISPHKNGVFAAGSFSLVKITNSTNKDSINKVRIFINEIFKTGKKTLFGGTYTDSEGNISIIQDKNSIPTLDYEDNNLDFKFSAISDEVSSSIEYRWWLEGNDENWEVWNNKNEIRFTNLHEGNYTFWVQARDIYGNKSEKLSYSFNVDPPWSRTIIAYIFYILFFIAFVWGAVQYSTRRLKVIINQATAEIQEQKNDIEHKNEEIVSSIRYAQRIQEAVIPNKKQMLKAFPDHFVLWKPRDIVSGDYYWMMEKEGKQIIAAADCTGHGVPGAFMSIMGISFLNEIANNPIVQTAASALDLLRQSVITSLNQEGSETNTKDGMDMSICVYDFENMTMEFAGAYNPMYMIRDGELSTIKADRMPIGIHDRDKNPFTNIKFNMHKGDIYYILSDGYIDQFGGPKGKKFMTKRFKQLILDIHKKPMAEQNEILWQNILDWRGDIDQLDDIIVIGIRV